MSQAKNAPMLNQLCPQTVVVLVWDLVTAIVHVELVVHRVFLGAAHASEQFVSSLCAVVCRVNIACFSAIIILARHES